MAVMGPITGSRCVARGRQKPINTEWKAPPHPKKPTNAAVATKDAIKAIEVEAVRATTNQCMR